MNKTVVIIIGIVVTGLLLGYYIYSQNARYYIQSGGKGVAYKIDRKTGKIWYIVRGKEQPVKDIDESTIRESRKKKLTLEEIAINMVKESNILGGNSADATIGNWTKKIKGTLKIIGWVAEKVDDQTYLVSYTFDDGSGARGYYFDVNLKGSIVRKVSGDIELEDKYGFLKVPQLDFKDVRNATWGMSKAEVKSTEKWNLIGENEFRLTYTAILDTVDAEIYYFFLKSDELCKALLRLKPPDKKTKDYYMEHFNKFKYRLEKRYGKTDTKESETGTTLTNSWKTDVTEINHRLEYWASTSELNFSSHVIWYSSIKRKEQFKKESQERAKEGTQERMGKKEETEIKQTVSPSPTIFSTRESKIYHILTCPKLGTEDLVEFASPQQARNAGGVPCKDCNP